MATAPKTHRPLNTGTPRQEHDRMRGSAQERGYDSSWHKVREIKVKQNPLCEDCEYEGLTVPVSEVDHIIPINGLDDPLRLDMLNLRSRCKRCHIKKTRMDTWIRGMYEHLTEVEGKPLDDARDMIVEKVEREQFGWGAGGQGRDERTRNLQ